MACHTDPSNSVDGVEEGSPRLKSRRPSRGWGSSSPVAGSPAQTPRFQRDERKGSGLRAGMTVDAEAAGEGAGEAE